MESIFDDEHKAIAPQNFQLAMLLCMLYIIVTFGVFMLNEELLLVLIAGSIGLVILIYFRNYLHNFDAAKAIWWVNSKILTNALLLFSLAIRYPKFSPGQLGGFDKQIKSYAEMFVIILTIADFIQVVVIGVMLQKIKNDFIGLLHTLGKFNAYYLPLPYLATLFISGAKSLNIRSLWIIELRTLEFVMYVIMLIPTIIVGCIFYKAEKYVSTFN